MDVFKKDWFAEVSPMWAGEAKCLKVEKLLFEKQTKYQHLQIFESESYGRVLVLDGVIQLTERDEFAYQEMMTFLALNSHPNPQRVLVIGGGDGGVVREVAKHPAVTHISMCEIDGEVVEACKAHIPSVAASFGDERLTLHIGDGFDFLRNAKDKYDVIITDASDPVVMGEGGAEKDGPAASLFKEEYYTLLRDTLTPEGILLSQGESMWLHKELIGKLITRSRTLYPVVSYAYTCVPTYPSGQIGMILCSKNKDTDFSSPVTAWDAGQCHSLALRYYSAEMHRAAFALPAFMRRYLAAL